LRGVYIHYPVIINPFSPSHGSMMAPGRTPDFSNNRGVGEVKAQRTNDPTLDGNVSAVVINNKQDP